MKKALSLLLALVLTFSVCFGLISCDNTNNPSNDNPTANTPGGDNPNTNKPFNVDLAGYVANIGNATALGISKKAKASISPMASYGTNHSGIQLLSYTTLSSDNVAEDKNYIVMSTTDYDANVPEADETGLTKVTFTKIVTENVTTETTGTKYIIANEGTISISATEGFKYTVYYNDSLVYNEVQDNDSNDKDAKIGVIVLDNLIDGMEYKVNYEGIGVETTITQDDINGEIDKLYVVNGYTFISFVPVGQSQRPSDTALQYDYDGVATYDKNGYFSTTTRQSFVIDNATGYVYQLKDFSIDTIKDGLIISSGKHFDMNVADTGELNFVQVVRNETLRIYNIFKDKYGNKYVQNDYLDAYDEENKTVYYTKTNYFLSQEGIAIHIDYTGQFNYSEMPSSFKVLEKMNADFTPSQISETENYKIYYSPCNGNSIHDESSVMISHIENGYLYMYSTQGGAYSYFKRVHSTLPYINEGNTPDNTRLYVEDRSYGIYGYDGGNWDYNCLKSTPIDYNTVLIWCDWSGTPKLYYGDVWGENAFRENVGGFDGKGFDDSKLTVLLENCICVPDWDFDLNTMRFRYTTFTETVFYKIIVDENGAPKAVNSETYVAPEQEIITLQPINK